MSCHRYLSGLSDVCTRELLHEAREYRYGPNYEQGVAYPHHGDKVEALLSLDRAGHVPNNTPHTIEFERHVRGFVCTLLESYWSTYKPSWYRGFKVTPMGSFPCDTKVGDIDEFDYLCVLDIPREYWKLTTPTQGTVKPGSPFHTNFAGHFKTFLQAADSDSPVRVTNVYTHGPATCVVMSWTCCRGHQHSVSIDISLAAEFEETTVEDMIRSRIDSLPAPFLAVTKNIGNYIFVNNNMGHDWHLSSCLYDIPLSTELDSQLSLKFTTLVSVPEPRQPGNAATGTEA